MHWDIFCRVIDNFGDIGVCWRLSRDLASRGQQVRLWTDDASALQWMAPEGNADGHGYAGVRVCPWPLPGEEMLDTVAPGDVVVEAFGCNPPDEFLARMQRPAPPVWINLEYLSAEAYVARSHGLPSPVMSGPARGLTKRFFYPGFTQRTGGLIREQGLLTRRDAVAESSTARREVLARLGVGWEPGQRVVTVFCYAKAPVAALLDQLALLGQRQPDAPDCHVLLAPGPAAESGLAWAASPAGTASRLHLHALPLLPQDNFDALLWSSDLNLMRGEDSAVRALWASRPHVWHIYPQDDGAHEAKLEAFMTLWMGDWPNEVRRPARELWRAWNGMATGAVTDDGDTRSGAAFGQALSALWSDPGWTDWQAGSRSSAEKLASASDLASRLLEFVAKAR